jgi:hypothetical protein
MNRYVVQSALLLLVVAVPALSQSPATLQKKYGTSDEKGRYKIRDGIGLKATFDANGRPSTMSIKPLDPEPVTKPNGRVVSRLRAMNSDTALEILEELVPSNTRGKETASFVESRGCTSINHKEHDQFMISIVTRCMAQGGGTYAIHIQWKNKNP